MLNTQQPANAKRDLLEKYLSRGLPRGLARPDAIPRRGTGTNAPLSFAQQRLWFHDRLIPGSAAYNVPAAFRFRGPLVLRWLEQSLNAVVQRHEALRTTFRATDGHPMQVIAPMRSVPLPLSDLQGLPMEAREHETMRLAGLEACQPFNLADGPLIRAKTLRLAADDHLLLVTVHHIVFDGWSVGVFLRELIALYKSFVEDAPPTLPNLPIQYADFTTWQRQRLQTDALATQVSYWKGQLEGAPSVLELPTDHARPSIQTFRGTCQSVLVPTALSASLQALSRQEATSLFMTLLAAFQVLLYRYTGQEDILVGTPMAGRTHAETEPLIGFFVNTVALRTILSGDLTFLELLQRVREVALNAYSHEAMPIEELVQQLQPERDLSRTPLFQVLFNMLEVPDVPTELPGLTVEATISPEYSAKYDLTLYVLEKDKAIQLLLVYNADLFSEQRMKESLDQYQYLLTQVVEAPAQAIIRYSLVTPRAETFLPNPRDVLHVAWEGTAQARFSQQARRVPARIAVVDPQDTWSYAELDARSNQLAQYLRAQHIHPGEVVAIYAHRGASLVWALLGVLKAGAAFVILDAAYPSVRLIEYLRAARPRGWLQIEQAGTPPEQLRNFLATLPCCHLELPRRADAAARGFLADYPAVNPSLDTAADDLAYIAFTSGSTGMPRGIVGTHRPVSHFLHWHTQTFRLTEADRFSMLSGLGHDPLLRDIFTPLWLGATLCIPPAETRVPYGQLAQRMKDSAISVAHLTPAMAQILTATALAPPQKMGENPPLPALRHLFLGGEALTHHDVSRLHALAPHATCVNFYGATETPQAMGYFVVPNSNGMALPHDPESAELRQRIPVGRGIEGVQLLVLNEAGHLAGVGELGQIYVRSPYLAREYLGDAALTAQRFIVSPFTMIPTDRLYMTGDLGRYLPDGNVQYLGRSDDQVKIRGFRIEPGEVETALRQHPAVRESIVLAREEATGDKRLVAYLVLHDDLTITAGDARAFLKGRLPIYMVPSTFVILDALPLTPNGKIDRRALPAPAPVEAVTVAGLTAPFLTVHHQLVAIWEELLDIRPVGIRDDFFDLGGHSLLAIRMLDRVAHIVGRKIPLTTLFAGATIEHLAQVLLNREEGAARAQAVIDVQRGGSRPPIFFLHGDFEGSGLYCANLARHLGEDQPFYVLPPYGIDGVDVPRTMEAMAANHLAALRAVQPQGPYILGGFCNAGVVAFEMAQQLRAQGQVVELLVLIDAEVATPILRISHWVISRLGALAGLSPQEQLQIVLILRYYDRCLKTWRQMADRKPLAPVPQPVQAASRLLRRITTLVSTSDTANGKPRTPWLVPPVDALRQDMPGTHTWVKAAYRARPYEGRIALFWAQDLYAGRHDTPTSRWARLARQIDVHVVPGEHLTCITTHVSAFAAKIRTSLLPIERES